MTARVWDGRDGSTSSVIKHAFRFSLRSVAFSSGLLAAATAGEITIWDRKTLCLIDTIHLSSLSSPPPIFCSSLSFPASGSSLALACRYSNRSDVVVWDIGGRTALATFQTNRRVCDLTLSPDGSQVFAEMDDDSFQIFDVSTGNTIQQTGREGSSWIPNFNGIPILHRGNHLMGRFSERYEHIPLLHFPTEVLISCVTVGSSMLAVGSKDGRILLVRS
jgi:WD40 repeat protein